MGTATPVPCRAPWDATTLMARPSHLVSPDKLAIDEIEDWISSVPEVVDEEVVEADVENMSSMRKLVEKAAIELGTGSGVARITPPDRDCDDRMLRRYYLAFGVLLGVPLGNYGRLYDVKDRGGDYTKTAIPVSQTRAATGLHTDSSALDVVPDRVGLICIRPAIRGGESRIACSIQAYQRLQKIDGELLEILQQPHLRDIVTPGADRSQRMRNQFPVFADDPDYRFTCRYMRFWIEKGYERAEVEIPDRLPEALDALDQVLEEENAVANFMLTRGEMLWVDNRTTLHDRTEYEDDPDAPRLLLRQWVKVAANS